MVKQLTVGRYKIIHTTSLLSFFFFLFNTNAFAYLNYKITISSIRKLFIVILLGSYLVQQKRRGESGVQYFLKQKTLSFQSSIPEIILTVHNWYRTSRIRYAGSPHNLIFKISLYFRRATFKCKHFKYITRGKNNGKPRELSHKKSTNRTPFRILEISIVPLTVRS